VFLCGLVSCGIVQVHDKDLILLALFTLLVLRMIKSVDISLEKGALINSWLLSVARLGTGEISISFVTFSSVSIT